MLSLDEPAAAVSHCKVWKLRNDTLCVGPDTECPLRDAECVRDQDVEAIGALRTTAGTKSSRMQDRNIWNIPPDGHQRSHSAVGIQHKDQNQDRAGRSVQSEEALSWNSREFEA